MHVKDRQELAISLRLNGRAVVVVGEGPVAERYRDSLRRKGAWLVSEGSKAQFAIVIDDPGAISRLKVRGTLVYAVDRPELCDFTLIEPEARAKARIKVKVEKQSAPKRPRPDVWRPALAKISAGATKISGGATKITGAVGEIRGSATGRLISIAKVTAPLAKAVGSGLRAMLLPIFAVFDIVASTVATRRERARQRPVALNLALARGGPLDDLAGERALAPAEPTTRAEHG